MPQSLNLADGCFGPLHCFINCRGLWSFCMSNALLVDHILFRGAIKLVPWGHLAGPLGTFSWSPGDI